MCTMAVPKLTIRVREKEKMDKKIRIEWTEHKWKNTTVSSTTKAVRKTIMNEHGYTNQQSCNVVYL